MFEFAMALPLLTMLLVGIIFGGIIFFNYIDLADAVEAGARTLATSRQQGTSACSQATTAVKSSNGNLTSSLITVAPMSFGQSTCSATLVQGDNATVSATYPCNLQIPFTSFNFCPVQGNGSTCPTSYCISATTTVYIE
jgi:Flp pilus assembly protein TadG